MAPTAHAPLALALHLARTKDAGDPYSFPFGKGRPGVLTYLRTRADGTSAGAELAWDEGVFSDLAGLRRAVPDPARLPSLGGRLRAFLDVELPLIRPGILGSATFALILSFNDTIRTSRRGLRRGAHAS